MKHRVFKPEARLAALVARPGGLSRETAVARAAARLAGQREPAHAAIEGWIAALEMRCAAADATDMGELRRLADRIIAAASTYEMEPLAACACRLADLVQLFARRGAVDAAVLDLHVQALRLLATGRQETLAQSMFAELDRLQRHCAER